MYYSLFSIGNSRQVIIAPHLCYCQIQYNFSSVEKFINIERKIFKRAAMQVLHCFYVKFQNIRHNYHTSFYQEQSLNYHLSTLKQYTFLAYPAILILVHVNMGQEMT